MNLPITAQTGITPLLDFKDKELLDVLKQTIAVDATDAEFKMFIKFCQGTGLNPFKRELWFIKSKSYTNKAGKHVDGKVQMMTGIQGFYAIANNHPQYDGMDETQYEYDANKNLIAATAKAYRKDRGRPSVVRVLMEEFCPEKTQYTENGNWFTKPHVMLGKVAESHALKRLFPNEMNGLYVPEALEKVQQAEQPLNVTPKKEAEKVPQWYYVPEATDKQVKFFEKVGGKEYKIYEKDAKSGDEVVFRNFWLCPENLGTKLKDFEIEQPEGPLEVEIGE